MWPLALFYCVYPHTVTLVWLQDACDCGGELVVVAWAPRLSSRTGASVTTAPWLLGLVTALVADHSLELVHDRVRLPLRTLRRLVGSVGWP